MEMGDLGSVSVMDSDKMREHESEYLDKLDGKDGEDERNEQSYKRPAALPDAPDSKKPKVEDDDAPASN